MRKKKKVRKFEAANDLDVSRFFTFVEMDPKEFEDEDEALVVDIEMLRLGSFTHKKYGLIEITEELLESIVKNFDDNVIGREISFDWNHEAKDASGWLKGLRVEDGVLIGTTELTESGIEAIKGKKYGVYCQPIS